MKESKFKIFLDKAKKLLPEIASVGGKLATGNYLGAITDVGEILTGKAKDNEQAKQLLRSKLPDTIDLDILIVDRSGKIL